MRLLAPLAVLLAFSACSQPDGAGNTGPDNMTGNVTIAKPPAPSAITNATDGTSLESPEVRALVERETIEDEHCRGSSGDDPETMRACNRRQQLLAQIERKGWCWGGSDIGAEMHWVRCASQPGYVRGQFDKPYFNDAEINEAEAEWASRPRE
jgi:hypothetical protein